MGGRRVDGAAARRGRGWVAVDGAVSTVADRRRACVPDGVKRGPGCWSCLNNTGKENGQRVFFRPPRARALGTSVGFQLGGQCAGRRRRSCYGSTGSSPPPAAVCPSGVGYAGLVLLPCGAAHATPAQQLPRTQPNFNWCGPPQSPPIAPPDIDRLAKPPSNWKRKRFQQERVRAEDSLPRGPPPSPPPPILSASPRTSLPNRDPKGFAFRGFPFYITPRDCKKNE